MRDFPSCFGENGVQIVDLSSSRSTRSAQNIVTCVYQCQLCNVSCFITITWTKNLMGQGLTICIDDSSDQSLCKVDIKPGLFSKRKGSRNLQVDSNLVDIFWDFSCSKFGYSPEPLQGFYLAIVFNKDLVLMLGDLENEVHKKIDVASKDCKAINIAKKEHIFGKKYYGAKAQFYDKGLLHDIEIECDTEINDPSFVIRVDGKTVIQVRRLKWKFRGNQTILVEGLPVQVYWDVHSWLFGNVITKSSAVFLFQSFLMPNKLCTGQGTKSLTRDSQSNGPAFSLILCAWKNE